MKILRWPGTFTDEQWFSLSNKVYLFAAIIAAIGSLFVYHFGKKLSRESDERIANANRMAQEAVLKSKQADVEIGKLQQDNLKLQIELRKSSRTADRRWGRISGNIIDK